MKKLYSSELLSVHQERLKSQTRRYMLCILTLSRITLVSMPHHVPLQYAIYDSLLSNLILRGGMHWIPFISFTMSFSFCNKVINLLGPITLFTFTREREQFLCQELYSCALRFSDRQNNYSITSLLQKGEKPIHYLLFKIYMLPCY